MLAHFSGNGPNEAPRILFKVTHGGADHLEHLHSRSWHDLELHWAATSDHALWISAEGLRNDLTKLLDSILDEKSSATSTLAAMGNGGSQLQAIVFRNELRPRNWPDGKCVAEMVDSASRSNSHLYAARGRLNGALLGVWGAAERTYRHPDFQLNAQGAILPAVTDLLKVLLGD
ncbi:hypothetical protein CFB43_22250 [Burkholderia sp. AU15512]|nr:hypothetical protein CFB43_22250 [Burkholderia sp. AU15512]